MEYTFKTEPVSKAEQYLQKLGKELNDKNLSDDLKKFINKRGKQIKKYYADQKRG